MYKNQVKLSTADLYIYLGTSTKSLKITKKNTMMKTCSKQT